MLCTAFFLYVTVQVGRMRNIFVRILSSKHLGYFSHCTPVGAYFNRKFLIGCEWKIFENLAACLRLVVLSLHCIGLYVVEILVFALSKFFGRLLIDLAKDNVIRFFFLPQKVR